MSDVMRISVYEDGLYRGTLNMPRPKGAVTEEWLKEEIEQRLPTMRGRRYTIGIG